MDVAVLTEGWTQCNEENEKGEVEAISPSFVVGLHRSAGEGAESLLDTMRCCSFPAMGLAEGPAPQAHAADDTNWGSSYDSDWYVDGEVEVELGGGDESFGDLTAYAAYYY